jgi:hypothetical protein
MGSVLNLAIRHLHRHCKFITSDEQANNHIVKLRGLGETIRFARQAFNPGPQHEGLTFDLLGMALAGAMHFWGPDGADTYPSNRCDSRAT